MAWIDPYKTVRFDHAALRDRYLDWDDGIHPNWTERASEIQSLTDAEWDAVGMSALDADYLWDAVWAVMDTALEEYLDERSPDGHDEGTPTPTWTVFGYYPDTAQRWTEQLRAATAEHAEAAAVAHGVCVVAVLEGVHAVADTATHVTSPT